MYRWHYAIALALAAGTLALHIAAGRRLGETGVLHEWDVLFSADPTVYMTSFTTGQNTYRWGGRSFVHPNISNVLYPVVSVTAATVHALHPTVPPMLAARRVGYLICPIASAVTVGVLFLTLITLELGPGMAVLLAVLYVASFSGLIFGSIPESYCLSGLALSLLFLAAAQVAQAGPRAIAAPLWVAIGAVLSSITITNIVPFALVATLARRRFTSLVGAVRWSAAVTAGALLLTVGGYVVGARIASHAPAFSPAATGQIEERHPFSPSAALVDFPLAVANTLAPPVPVKAPADPVLRQQMRFTLTYQAPRRGQPGGWWRAALVLATLIASGVAAFWAPAPLRTVLAGAWAVLAFNWLLHGFYGSELFLYSQHWAIPLLITLAALAAVRGALRASACALLVLLTVFCVWNSAVVWHAVLGLLEVPSSQIASRTAP